MSREDPQLKIRLPAELKARLEDSAHRNERTLNAEIVHRLQLTMPDAETPTGAEILEALREMKLRFEAIGQSLEAGKKKR